VGFFTLFGLSVSSLGFSVGQPLGLDPAGGAAIHMTPVTTSAHYKSDFAVPALDFYQQDLF
jgi:hypothetical protein